jgi:hypothetical protein
MKKSTNNYFSAGAEKYDLPCGSNVLLTASSRGKDTQHIFIPKG